MKPIIPDDLRDIEEKVSLGQRLSAEDGMRLYETPDLNAVGYLANIARERMCGNVAWVRPKSAHQLYQRLQQAVPVLLLLCKTKRRAGLCIIARRYSKARIGIHRPAHF